MLPPPPLPPPALSLNAAFKKRDRESSQEFHIAESSCAERFVSLNTMRIHLVLLAALAILVASCFASVSARLTQRELEAVEARELFFTPPAWWNDNVNSWWNHIKGWSKAQWQEISASELAKW